MSSYDAPNQQVVRPDGSAPWQEGDGGSTLEPAKPKPKPKTTQEEVDTTVTPSSG